MPQNLSKRAYYATYVDDYGAVMKRLEERSALFVLELKECHKITQAAIQGIIEGTTNLMQVSLICGRLNPLKMFF